MGLIQESYNRSGGEDLKKTLKSYKEFYISYIRNEKREQYNESIHSAGNKQKELWSIIKTETSGNSRPTPDLPPREELNNFFTTVADRIHCDPSPDVVGVRTVPSTFFLSPVSPDEIVRTINNLKTKSTMDIHNLNTKILQWSAQYIASPLSDIINECFVEAIVPLQMKIAKIIPVFKKGDHSDCANYRPIAVLPALSKVLEATLLERLLGFLQAQAIISDSQYGFRKGKSTIDAVRSLLDFVWNAMESGEETGAVLCDLSKAFDCIHHRRLITKLEFYGIRGKPLALFKSYLSDRKQGVYSNGQLSSLLTVRRGVAQGSLMGPLMFLLFLNDLPENLTFASVLFADDTTLLVRDSEIAALHCKTSAATLEAGEWFATNGLELNASKTRTMCFTSKRNTSIEATSAKLLGITLDTRLTWLGHTDDLLSTLATATYAVRRVRQIVGEEAAVLTYHALFHSRLTYGLELWGESSHAKKVFIQQKKAIRAIEQTTWSAHCRPLFRKFRIMPLPSAYLYKQLIHAKKRASTYQNRGESTNRTLRNTKDVSIPFHRINSTATQHRHLELFNMLPAHWRGKSDKKFQQDLKKLLTEEIFYEIEEFKSYLKNEIYILT